MFKILNKKEIENLDLFYKYINLLACPTDFSIGSGVIDFRNNDDMLCASYYVNYTNEMNLSSVMYVNSDGNYDYIHKSDKYLCGIRPSINYSKIKNKSRTYFVNSDISVCEYGYFPKTMIDRPQRYEDTGVSITLPTSKNMFGKPEYCDFTVYKEKFKDNYFIEYPIYGMVTRIRDKFFYNEQKACFLIEPIRFWIDSNNDTAISQDVILGGLPYRMFSDMPYTYDDYDESDVCEALKVVEEDIRIIDELINGDIKIKRK